MLAALALALITTPPPAKLTFVRHAETLANSSGRYSAQTIDSFSERGKRQIAGLTALLNKDRFDIILVSPAPRAIKTIAPYLRATNQRARIWPLLYECCTGRRPKGAHATSFSYDGKVKVAASEAELFEIVPKEARFPAAMTYDAGLAQVRAAINEYSERYKPKRVLLVGHSGMGGQFLHALTGRWIAVLNACPIRVNPP